VGINIAISNAMIAITTKSSIKVNAFRLFTMTPLLLYELTYSYHIFLGSENQKNYTRFALYLRISTSPSPHPSQIEKPL